MLIFDTETCGLHGPIILIQYTYYNGNIDQSIKEIETYDVWLHTVQETIDLIESFTQETVCGFNLVFDWFHLQQMYSTLVNLPLDCREEKLSTVREEYAAIEKDSRDGPCIKPVSALDLMLFARKGPYQSTMERKPIVIKKVPVQVVDQVCSVLEEKVKLRDIYFSRRKTKGLGNWKIEDTKDPNFKNIVLRFKASGALKNIIKDALGISDDSILKFTDISLDKRHYPEEFGYAPFFDPNLKNTKQWPEVILKHIVHWKSNLLAREYARKDVEYTLRLAEYFGWPEPGDDDSVLACAVASVRWKGFPVDLDKMKTIRAEIWKKKFLENGDRVPTAPKAVTRWLQQVCSDFEKEFFNQGTSKKVLEGIVESKEWEGHPVQGRASRVLEARKVDKEIELYDKIIQAGRFHVSNKIIGALSGRMSGADGLNAQGIKRDEYVREAFLIYPNQGLILSGGDFDSFEVTLADAVYNDPKLREFLQSGKKIHGYMGTLMFPEYTYDQILADKKLYSLGKNGVFTLIYGGNEHTLEMKYKVPQEVGRLAVQTFLTEFPEVGRKRAELADRFSSLDQPKGIGSKIYYKQPPDFIESLLGFKRYFNLENSIIKALFEFAQIKISNSDERVIRRDRIQTVGGATQSALYASAFALQESIKRAVGNHIIQSSGATITKNVQRKICDLQPSGINDYLIMTANIHDEILCAHVPELTNKIKEVVDSTIESYRDRVPLLGLTWKSNLRNWSEK